MNTTHSFSTWDEVGTWVNGTDLRITPWYLCESSDLKYPRDAFSLGQIASKAWLLQTLYPIATKPLDTWVLLGCWIGSLVPFLHQSFIINRIYGIDQDPAAVQLSEEFNRSYVADSWKYKGVIDDVSLLDVSNLQFQTSGELIQIKPAVVINTSCEHMDNEWFNSADTDQLIVMQTNNSPDFDGHINVCSSVDEMRNRYPMSNTLYAGEIVFPAYTRYMQIGFK